jgi:ribonuclease-3
MPEVTISRDSEALAKCQQTIGYQFRNLAILHAALTHASGADSRLTSNERLEFLGDAILGCVVCELLFQRFPDYLEGELTRIKSVVVSRSTCAKISRRLGLGRFLILGKGMTTQTQVPASVLADVFESLVAAMYLDGGIEQTREFIHRHIGPEIDKAVGGYHGGNYKSLLQQLAQKEFGATPVYQVLDEKGPDHSKCFKVAAVIAREHFSPAWGRNKKEAEQRAAYNALCQINGKEAPSQMDDESLVDSDSELL